MKHYISIIHPPRAITNGVLITLTYPNNESKYTLYKEDIYDKDYLYIEYWIDPILYIVKK